MALLYNQDTLDDDSTVGSHGLTEGTTVTLSMAQAPERGRAARQERWALLLVVGAAAQHPTPRI